MIKVAFVRGKYLNNFEGQNYRLKDIKLTGIASKYSLHKQFPFPVIRLSSIADLENLGILGRSSMWRKVVKVLGNRILGDSQILFGLESFAGSFDLFHTADPHYYFSYQLAKLRSKNKIMKLLVTSWETIPFNNEGVKAKKRIKYFTLRHADHFICHTEKAKRCLVKEGVSDNKITVIRLGVDLSKFKVHSSKFKTRRGNGITILFVGRLVEEKGVLDLYEAFKNIKYQSRLNRDKTTKQKAKINLELKIIGQGGLKFKLEKLISKDGLGSCVSIETKDYEDMPSVYQEVDILVFPAKRTKTWEEQYGMVLTEAMASGLPIIAYNTGAISEIMGDSGILIRERNIKELSAWINRLIDANYLRFKLSRMGRERAEKMFDSRKTAKSIAEIYMELSTNSI